MNSLTASSLLPLKIAIAIAIIRTKKPDVSLSDYIKQLQRKFMFRQFQQNDELLVARAKIDELEAELSQWTKKSERPSDNLTDETDKINYTLTPPSSSSDSQVKQWIESTPIHQQPVHGALLLQTENKKFLQSITCLQNISSDNHRLTQNGLIDAAVQNIMNLSELMGLNTFTVSQTNMLQAADAVGKLLLFYPWLEKCDAVMKQVYSLIETVLTRMKQPSEICQFSTHRQKHALMKMLVAFVRMSSPQLSIPIFESLLNCWEFFCTELRNSRRTGVPILPTSFESNFFIINTIELISKVWLEDSEIDLYIIHETQKRLEASLLQIDDNFPLVARAVWNITPILETILQRRELS